MSVSVVTNVPDAMAGSTPPLVRIIGMNVPKNEPNIKFNNKETEITKLKP